MIYLDSAATSFYKPKLVAHGGGGAFHRFVMAGRGEHAPPVEAARVL